MRAAVLLRHATLALVLLSGRPAGALAPAGPGPKRFMWQGTQKHFVQADGTECIGRVALAIGEDLVCFVAADDTLRCAGSLGTRRFGPRFLDVGMKGVEQILVSPTRSKTASVPANGLCVKKTDGTAWCTGSYNQDGQFGNATSASTSTFTRWGCASDLAAIGTGNWDQICAINRRGRVSCAGDVYGSTPAYQDADTHSSFWIDPLATLYFDDPQTFRASNGRTDCRVRPRSPDPFVCHGGPGGKLVCAFVPAPPDDFACWDATPWIETQPVTGAQTTLWEPTTAPKPLIVDGGTFLKGSIGLCGGKGAFPDPDTTTRCWLTVDGEVYCVCRGPINDPTVGSAEFFLTTSGRILALATDPRSTAMCAVPEDGSLWCIGINTSGRFGSGTDDPLLTETQVQPPGSVLVKCDAPTPPPPVPGPVPAPPPTGSCPCPGSTRLAFTSVEGAGACGNRNDLAKGVLDLACGGLYFGGGGTAVPLPVLVPDQTKLVLDASGCTPAGDLTLTARTAAQETRRGCTDTGCPIGAPMPVPVPESPPVSSCLLNVHAAPAAGVANCASGDARIDLRVETKIYLTGDTALQEPGVQPCPICAPSLASDPCPGSACASCCHGGPNAHKPCSPDSSGLSASFPTSLDCPPDASDFIDTVPSSFALTTGTVSWTATVATNDTESFTNQTRVFSGFCRDAEWTGAFETPPRQCWENGMAVGAACTEPAETCEQRNNGAFGPAGGAVTTIAEFGAAAGFLGDGQPHASTLGALFTIAQTGDHTVDAVDDFPGPAAISLPGEMRLLP